MDEWHAAPNGSVHAVYHVCLAEFGTHVVINTLLQEVTGQYLVIA